MHVRLAIALVLAAGTVACTRAPGVPIANPAARYATAAGVVDGTVYLVGGCDRTAKGDRIVATVERYDSADRTWARCAPMSSPRVFAAAAVVDGRLYVFGGLDVDGRPLASVEVYDPARDAWSACAPMRRPLGRLAAAPHMARMVIVAGGMDADEVNVAQQRVFLPLEGGTWRDWVPPFTNGRHGLGLVDADDGTERMFAIGGYGDDGPLATVDWWGVGDGSDDGTGGRYGWWPGPPLHVARGFHGVARIGHLVYAVGGRCREIPPTEVLDIDDMDAGWRPAAPLPKDLCRFSMVAWRGHLLVFGGETDFGSSVNTDVLEYDPDADTWSVR